MAATSPPLRVRSAAPAQRARILQRIVAVTILLATLSACAPPAGHHGIPGDKALSDRESVTPQSIRQLQELADTRQIESFLIRQGKAQGQPGNSIFAHPGLLMLIDWGGGRAEDATDTLIRAGYGRQTVKVTNRDAKAVYTTAMAETGTHYLGLHYSMGGAPETVAASVKSIEQASRDRGTTIRYHPILVDPVRATLLLANLDTSSPHLGDIFLVVSSKYSFLRASISDTPSAQFPTDKIHVITSEDFGVNWGHFSFLSDVRSEKDKASGDVGRSKEIFSLIFAMAVADLPATDIDFVLDYLRAKYAIEDGRQPKTAWLATVAQGWPAFQTRLAQEGDRPTDHGPPMATVGLQAKQPPAPPKKASP